MERAIVINDLHIPFEDKRAVRLIERFIVSFEPDFLFLNGDITDFWGISKFMKDPRKGFTLAEEIEQTREQLAMFAHISKRIIYIEGNHSFRLRKFILNNAKELLGLDGLTIQEQFGLKNLGIEYIESVGQEAVYQYGDVLIGHFNKVNKHSAYTAKNLLDEKGMSLIQAHTHRAGIHYRRTYAGDLVAIENGCLCDLNPEYVNHPNWQHAFTIIYKDKKGHCEMSLILINNYQFHIGKHLFK